MVLSKFVLNHIFAKLQDFEKETEFIFLLGLPTGEAWNNLKLNLYHVHVSMYVRTYEGGNKGGNL